VNTSLRFCRRHALHAVTAGFKLKTTVYAVAADLGDNFFKATMFAFVGTHDLYAPATRFGVATVHTEQVTRKQRGFVTAGTGAHFHKRVTLIVRIFRQQKHLELLFHLFRTRFCVLQLFLRHPGEVLDRARLHEEVWGYDFDPGTNVADVFVSYLRRKLEAGGEPRLLHTIRGAGYVLRA